ncbi:MAG: deoxyribodipyrimidine photo-lyase [Rickettsiales bacterium]
MTKPLNLVWIRRDMRLHDHRALAAALKEEGDIQPVFVFDTDILARFDNPEDRRITFLAEILFDMHQTLQKRGGGMLVLYGKAEAIIPKLCHSLSATRLIAARDVEPATQARDHAVRQAIQKTCSMEVAEDHLILFPERVLKDDGSPYAVFTPYSKRWHKTLQEADYQEARVNDKDRYADFKSLVKQAKAVGLHVVSMDSVAAIVKDIGYRVADIGEWKVGGGKKRLALFMKNTVSQYKDTRNFPGVEGTSKLSPYLRFGVISIRECLRAALSHAASETWVTELIWRDFYAMVLFHYPDIVDMEYQKKYRKALGWNDSKKDFQRWAEGQTGYPFIDAAMRQLRQTGWMHNRARMVVASFLTKDLQIDWRKGEEHFAQFLMDYDLASNNGGWQWSASTGTDAQPWFRIFNPIEQSKKFDPKGEYIRLYVPELKELALKDIHAPWKAKTKADYPEPMVDHDAMRKKTLAMFKAVR